MTTNNSNATPDRSVFHVENSPAMIHLVRLAHHSGFETIQVVPVNEGFAVVLAGDVQEGDVQLTPENVGARYRIMPQRIGKIRRVHPDALTILGVEIR